MSDPLVTIDQAIDLHAAGYLASCTRLAEMLKDRSHTNDKSKVWNEEAEIAEYHRKQAFAAKNVLAEVQSTLRKMDAKSA